MKKRFALIIMLITCIGTAGCSAKQPKSDEVTDYLKTIAESNVKISEDSPAESKSDTDVQKSAESEAPEKSKEQSPPEEKTYKAENEPSDPASQTDKKVDESLIEPSEYPSPSEEPLTTNVMKVSSEIAKELGNGFSYIEDVINEDFSGLTQEQFDRIAIYKSTHAGRHPYNEAVAAGLIDSDSPKITREKIQEIIQEALNKDLLPDNTKFSIENSDGEIFSYYNSADPKCFFGYILNEAKKIQPYYDETTDNTYDKYYYPVTDENGNPTEAIKITIDSTKGTIQYIRLNEKGDDGKSKKEILYES